MSETETFVQFGKPIIQKKILEPLKGLFIYGHKTQYQTLVYPQGVLPGVRTLERWPHLKGLARKRILEIGCSSGIDGILALVCGAKSYYGYDNDDQALSLGREVAKAWGVEAHLVKADVQTFVDWPSADVLFLFSVTQRFDRDLLTRAAKASEARVIYLEDHGPNDITALALMSLLADFEWKKVAAYDSNGQGWVKKLWKGAR